MCINSKIVSVPKKSDARIKGLSSESEKNYVAIYSTINHQNRNAAISEHK